MGEGGQQGGYCGWRVRAFSPKSRRRSSRDSSQIAHAARVSVRRGMGFRRASRQLLDVPLASCWMCAVVGARRGWGDKIMIAPGAARVF